MRSKRNIPCACQMCGETFYVTPSTFRFNANRFCSRRCYNASRTRSIEDRFWEHVDMSGDCWIWTGPVIDQGYGKLGRSGRAGLLAHRVSWEIHNGPIPEGLNILHTCDVRACVNPEHLYAGTQAENMRDVAVRGRRRGRKLTDEDVRAIRARYRHYSRHANLRLIAEEYGISISYVWHIIHRRIFRHVD